MVVSRCLLTKMHIKMNSTDKITIESVYRYPKGRRPYSKPTPKNKAYQ